MTGTCNCTQKTVFPALCGSWALWTLLLAVSTMLLLFMCLNILCCFAKLCSGRSVNKGKMFVPHFRRSLSLRLSDMEENPIYGNISYVQTRVAPPACPLSVTHHKPASKGQDCYANLAAMSAKRMSGRSSPQIHYSDVMTLQGDVMTLQGDVMTLKRPLEETEGNADCVSVLSGLYASVQTDRTKTLDSSESNAGYANHV